MSQIPREETSYKEIYKNIDIDLNKQINTSNSTPFVRETIVIEDYSDDGLIQDTNIIDQCDDTFCKNNNINHETFINWFYIFDNSFNKYIKSQIKNLKPHISIDPCDICGRANNSDDNKLITCQGCLINVHETCYGIPYHRNGFWMCARCMFYFEDATCMFCSSENGIMKQTHNGLYSHVFCASIIPNLSFGNRTFKEPVYVDEYKGLEGLCTVCSTEDKALVRCSYMGCPKMYHTDCCADKIYCDIGNRVIYCDDHRPDRRKRVKSTRNKILNRTSYPEIHKPILLRDQIPLKKPKIGEVLKILKTTPFIVNYIDNADIKYKLIAEYWIEKKKTYGFYYTDILIALSEFRNE